MHVLKFQLHLLAHLEVQSAQGLIKKEDLRLVDQSAGDGDPLLLAAGERADTSLLKALQIHQIQDSSDFAFDHVLGCLLLLESESDIVVNIHMREQCVALKHRVDGSLVRRKVRDGLAA